MYNFCTFSDTRVVLEQNREITKRNKTRILFRFFGLKGLPFPSPLSRVSNRVSIRIWAAVMVSHADSGWGLWLIREKKKGEKRNGDFPPYSDSSSPFSWPFSWKERCRPWVPELDSRMQEKRGKEGKLAFIWATFLDFDFSFSIFLILFTFQSLLIVGLCLFVCFLYLVQSFYL